MAQILDDCFAFGGDLMPTDEALAILDGLALQDMEDRPGLANLRGALIEARTEANQREAPYTVNPFGKEGG